MGKKEGKPAPAKHNEKSGATGEIEETADLGKRYKRVRRLGRQCKFNRWKEA